MSRRKSERITDASIHELPDLIDGAGIPAIGHEQAVSNVETDVTGDSPVQLQIALPSDESAGRCGVARSEAVPQPAPDLYHYRPLR